MPRHWIFAFEGQVSDSALEVAGYPPGELVEQFQREAEEIAHEIKRKLSSKHRGRFDVIIDFSEGSFGWFGEVHYYAEWMATVGGAIGLVQLIASVVSDLIRRRLNKLRTRPRTRVTVISRPGSKILSRFEAGAHIATAIGVIVAVATVIVGYCQWRGGQEFEREKRAFELVIKYDELMKERASSTDTDSDAIKWRENLTMVIAESIFLLQRGDKGWEETVRDMVNQHRDFLLTGRFLDCRTFDKDFIRIVNEEMKQDVCRR